MKCFNFLLEERVTQSYVGLVPQGTVSKFVALNPMGLPTRAKQGASKAVYRKSLPKAHSREH